MTKSSKFKNLLSSWNEISDEFCRIHWGNFDELRNSVRVILVSIILWALITYAVDLTLQTALNAMRKLLLRQF